MENKEVLGHVAVLLTILIWGTTFISTPDRRNLNIV